MTLSATSRTIHILRHVVNRIAHDAAETRERGRSTEAVEAASRQTCCTSEAHFLPAYAALWRMPTRIDMTHNPRTCTQVGKAYLGGSSGKLPRLKTTTNGTIRSGLQRQHSVRAQWAMECAWERDAVSTHPIAMCPPMSVSIHEQLLRERSRDSDG